MMIHAMPFTDERYFINMVEGECVHRAGGMSGDVKLPVHSDAGSSGGSGMG